MDIRESPLQNEINAITASGANPVFYYWDCDILVGNQVVRPFKVLHIDFGRQYFENYMDNINLEVQLQASVWMNVLYPRRDDILISLYRRPLQEDGSADTGRQVAVQTYRAYPVATNDPSMSPRQSQPDSAELIDLQNLLSLNFQLLPRGAEQLRLEATGGIFHRQVPGNLLRDLIALKSQNVQLDDNNRIRNVDMVEPDNKQVRPLISIPHRTPVMELPKLLQEEQGGVYNAGMEFFLQDDTLYLYPRYGINRFASGKRTLTVIIVPESAYPGAERTYRETTGQVIMMSTGGSNNQDISESAILNRGNGVSFTHADQLLDGGVVTAEGRTVARRGVGNAEYVGEQRKSGLNYAPLSDRRITSNIFRENSRLAANLGMVYNLIWENCDPTLLYPGMPARIYYLKAGQVEERRGVLSSAHYYVQPDGPVGTFRRHLCTGNLSLFLSKTPYDPEDNQP